MIERVGYILFYVEDPLRSAEFYRSLGFEIPEQNENFAVVRTSNVLLHLHNQNEVPFDIGQEIESKGAGVFVALQVQSVDDMYRHVTELGLKPSSSPTNWAWGNREFVLRDPDRYKLVFFQPIEG